MWLRERMIEEQGPGEIWWGRQILQGLEARLKRVDFILSEINMHQRVLSRAILGSNLLFYGSLQLCCAEWAWHLGDQLGSSCISPGKRQRWPGCRESWCLESSLEVESQDFQALVWGVGWGKRRNQDWPPRFLAAATMWLVMSFTERGKTGGGREESRVQV